MSPRKHKLWLDKSYPVNGLLTKEITKTHINTFLKDYISKLNNNQHILILFRIQWNSFRFATIGQLQSLNIEDKDYFYNYILNVIPLKDDIYINKPILNIIFSYGVRDGLSQSKTFDLDINSQTYYNFNLPITFDPLHYGKLIHKTNNIYFMQLKNNNIAIIETKDKMNKIKLVKDGTIVYEWIDKFIDSSTFIRQIGKNKYTFVNNELKLLTVDKSNKFIKPITKATSKNSKIATMDLETYVHDKKQTPYCLSFYDGIKTNSYYITDYLNF